MNMNWLRRGIIPGIGAAWVAIAVLLAFLFGFFVMLLWNWLMPAIFGLPAITYWQAWGLVLLSHLLFKSNGNRNQNRGPRTNDWKSHARSRLSPNDPRNPGSGTSDEEGPRGANAES